MQYFSSFLFAPTRPSYPRPSLQTRLRGPRLLLRLGDPADWASWRQAREGSRPFLVPWEPSWPLTALTYDHFCAQLRRQTRDWRHGTGYSFQIGLLPEGYPADHPAPESLTVIGGISLNEIIRGIAQKGSLGYWISEPHARQGFMTEAATIVMDFAFNDLKLHRIEAACLPANAPSQRLLRRLGFEQEGLARSYLRIRGAWEDHLLWGKVAPD